MGTLAYEGTTKTTIDDRALAHIQIVINTKLRRNEAFCFTWREDPTLGGGRISIWIHSASALVYKYHGGRPPTINRQWLDALAFTANSPEGLRLVPEPATTLPTEQHHSRMKAPTP